MNIPKKPALISLLLFGAGCVFALLQSQHIASLQEAEKQQRFGLLVDQSAQQLVQRMQTYEYGLRGARGAIMTQGAMASAARNF
jgi:CHASE1-domain containing sensor protein